MFGQGMVILMVLSVENDDFDGMESINDRGINDWWSTSLEGFPPILLGIKERKRKKKKSD